MVLAMLAAGAASGDPVLVVREGGREARLAGVQLSLEAGRVAARLAFPNEGQLTVRGSLAGGDLDLDVAADRLPPETLPFLLRTGPTPRCEGELSGRAKVSGRADQRIRVELDATLPEGWLEWIGLRFSAPLHAEGTLELIGPTLVDLRVAAAAAERRHATAERPIVEAKELAGRVRYERQVLTIQDLTGAAFEGDWQAGLRMDFGHTPRPFSVDARVESEPNGMLVDLRTDQRSPLLGHFDAVEGTLRLEGLWTDDWTQTLSGGGRVRIRGGRLQGSPILPAVWNGLVEQVPLGLGQPVPEFDPSETEIVEGTSTFRVEDGAIHVEEGETQTLDYVARGRGLIRFDTTLDLDGHISLTARGLQRMFTMTSLPGPRVPVDLGWIPMRVTGTLAEPRARAAIARLPVRAARSLFGHILRP